MTRSKSVAKVQTLTQKRNGSNFDATVRRRENVARLRIAGLSLREIALALARLEPPIINEATGKPVSHVLVQRDMEIIKADWRANARASMAEHIERQCAEIADGKRRALQFGDLGAFARFIALEVQLLGTDAPQKFEDWTDRDWREYAREQGYTEHEVIAEAERIIAASASREFVDSPRGDQAEAIEPS